MLSLKSIVHIYRPTFFTSVFVTLEPTKFNNSKRSNNSLERFGSLISGYMNVEAFPRY